MKSVDKLILLDIALQHLLPFKGVKATNAGTEIDLASVKKKSMPLIQNQNSLLDSISNSPFAPWEDSQIPSNYSSS